MEFDKAVVERLVNDPQEALSVEVKTWISLDTAAGRAKLIKGCMALRNFNGGYFVIGINDKTLEPDSPPPSPWDARQHFHVDNVQRLVSKFASTSFAVAVAFVERNGIDHPVICVAPGVITPVAATGDLMDGPKTLIKTGAVYFRTLNSGGPASSSEVRPGDWNKIMEICFNNREADIGRFFRRHLTGKDSVAALSSLLGGTLNPAQPKSLTEKAVEFIGVGEAYYRQALAHRKLSAKEQRLTTAGSWHVSLVIDPPTSFRPDREFMNRIGSANPNYTGWPIWLDSRHSGERKNQAVVVEKGWQALIFSDFASEHLDFQRFEPAGRLYLRRVLQDDAVRDKVAPGTAFDPIIAIIRVAEAIAVGRAIATALDCVPESSTLAFAFEWRGMKNRQLYRWGNSFDMMAGGTAFDDIIQTTIEVPLDTPLSALGPYVEEAVADLFNIFDGSQIPSPTIEDWTRRVVERRLSSG